MKNKKAVPVLRCLFLSFFIVSFAFTPVISVLAQEAELTSSSAVDTIEANINSIETSDSQVINTPVEDDIDSGEKSEIIKEEEESESMMMQSSTPTDPILPSGLSQSSKRFVPTVDETTGALEYSYDLNIPPGRNGLSPELKLSYNSEENDNQSIAGYGWKVSIPYISRTIKHGSDQLYTTNYQDFVSSLSGELVQLTQPNPSDLDEGTYAAKIENGPFISYEYVGGIWTAQSKDGTVYAFGSTASDRKDNPSDSSQIYTWMVSEIRDTNDNYIKYEYYKHNGQIYPDIITYTGNGTTDGVFEIEFDRETRTDVISSYESGFLVSTDYRISEIGAKVSGNPVRSYAFDYTTGDNGARSILYQIIESGTDVTSTTITLPPVELTGIKNTGSNVGWTSSSSWTAPSGVTHDGASLWGDINGDGYTDLLISYHTGGTDYKTAYLNNGDGTWTTSSAYEPPVVFVQLGWPPASYGYTLQDLNGDGLADLFQSNRVCMGFSSCWDETAVYINTGSGWSLSSTYTIPTSIFWEGNRLGTLADLNGDGLVDIYRSYFNLSTIPSAGGVYLNNGDGTWTSISLTSWVFPYASNDNTVYYPDLNGDGITDIVHISYNNSNGTTSTAAHLGDGAGQYISASSWAPSLNLSFFYPGTPSDFGTRFADINGDGLPDLVYAVGWYGTTYKAAYLNTGTGWSSNISAWTPATNFTNGFIPSGFLLDLNADAVTDIVQYISSTSMTVYLNNAEKPDIISNIQNSAGASTDISYTLSSKYVNGSAYLNPNLPLIIPTVSETVTNDGNAGTATSSYTYSDGLYHYDPTDYRDRKFAGFGKIIKTDAVGNITNTYYHQGDASNSSVGEYNDHVSKIGKIYRVENYDSSGNLYKKTINTWDKYNLGTGRDFVKLAQSVSSDYDGNSTHKDIAESYTYDDTNGNTLTKTEWGEVTGANDGTFTDTGIDDRKTTLTYATDGAYLVGLPETEKVTDHSNVTVKEILHEYDGQALGTVILGNETKTKELISTGSYKTTEKDYDGTYGLVTNSHDANGNITTYSPDSYNLYPETVTDTLSNVEKFYYDYSSGKVTDYYDKNSSQFTTVYDGFGRPLEEKIPDAGGQVTKAMYVYDDTNLPNSVYKRNYLNPSLTTDSYTYMDGLGRPIQTRTQAATAGDYRVSDTIYDVIGRVYKQSLPYFASGSAHTAPTSTAALYSESLYDPLGRITKISNTVGDTLYAYDNWYTEITDPNGKIKGYEKDAFGNLVKVDEHNQAATYTTRYYWDATGNLASIKDASNNVRAFAYDKLGRRISADDLHTLADTTFGLWQYVYDDQGNLKSRIDAAGVQTDYNYDQLNRVIKEDDTSNSGLDISFAYDTCANGVSKLCTVTQLSGTTTDYDYDLVGNVASETETISSTGYTTAYTYDYQNNITNINYPDSADVMYDYNDAGMVKSISRQEPGGSVVSVMDAVDYAENGKPSGLGYANSMKIDLTYDPAQLYRLVNISGAPFQDISYTYDPVGNILNITDIGTGDAAKDVDYTYDDLHRLTDARTNSVATGSTYNENYRYDALGNFTYFNAIPYSYAGNTGTNYANPHAVTSVNSVAYSYDNNGNLTTDSTNTYSWNYRNEMTKAVTPSATNIYMYDHTGKRLTLYDGFTTTTTPNKYYETDGTDITKRIYLGDMQVATVKNGTTETYFTPDHLNSTSYAVDSTGTVTQALDYYPFGDIRVNSGTTDEIHKYIGERYDADTGLNYLNARYYNSPIGRFISEDPVFWNFDQAWLTDPQNQNSYSYSRNSPITLSDPTGKSFLSNLFGVKTAYAPGMHESFTQGITDSQYKVNYASNVNTPISAYSKYNLQDSMIQSGEHSTLITRTNSTPEQQAQIMYNNTMQTGVDTQLNLYSSYGDQVISMYPNLNGMISKMYELGPSNVSSHLKDPKVTNIFDIAPSSIKNKDAFISAIQNNPNIDTKRFLTPFTQPKDTSYHLEIPQPKK